MPPCHGGGQGFKSPSGRHYASVAQLVEQGTENPRVTGSIPVLGTPQMIFVGLCASGSVVERLLAKEKVAGSTPVSRFFYVKKSASERRY